MVKAGNPSRLQKLEMEKSVENLDCKNIIVKMSEGINRYLFNCLDSTFIAGVSKYSLNGKAKRIRPLLVLMVISSFGQDWKKYTAIASVIELLHTATLVQDDIMDESGYRRGKKANHLVYGDNLAILAGDYLFAMTIERIIKEASVLEYSPMQINFIIKRVINTLLRIISGQADEISARKKNVSGEKLKDILTNKTASFFGLSMELGGFLIKRSEDELKILYGAGVSLGNVFQIADDIIDQKETDSTAGKNTGVDKRNGTKNILSTKGLSYSLKWMGDELKKYKEKLNELDCKKELLNEILTDIIYSRLDRTCRNIIKNGEKK